MIAHEQAKGKTPSTYTSSKLVGRYSSNQVTPTAGWNWCCANPLKPTRSRISITLQAHNLPNCMSGLPKQTKHSHWNPSEQSRWLWCWSCNAGLTVWTSHHARAFTELSWSLDNHSGASWRVKDILCYKLVNLIYPRYPFNLFRLPIVFLHTILLFQVPSEFQKKKSPGVRLKKFYFRWSFK